MTLFIMNLFAVDESCAFGMKISASTPRKQKRLRAKAYANNPDNIHPCNRDRLR